MNAQFANEQEKLLHDIGVLSFVVIELSLYLDTHPTDQNAMKYFNHYNHLANQARQEYSAKYTPLTLSYGLRRLEIGSRTYALGRRL